MLRSIIASIFIVPATVAWAVIAIIHIALFRNDVVFFHYARTWARFILRAAGIHVQIKGAAGLKGTERHVYVVNHTSLADIPILLAHIPDNIRIMYKQELERIPVFGFCLKISPFIAVVRQDAQSAGVSLRRTIASMRTGTSVVIFPEGTRNDGGPLGEFRGGAFLLAAQSGRSIVPVTIVGSAGVLPAGSLLLRAGNTELCISPPIAPQDLPASGAESAAYVRNIINTQLVRAQSGKFAS